MNQRKCTRNTIALSHHRKIVLNRRGAVSLSQPLVLTLCPLHMEEGGVCSQLFKDYAYVF